MSNSVVWFEQTTGYARHVDIFTRCNYNVHLIASILIIILIRFNVVGNLHANNFKLLYICIIVIHTV